VGNSIGLEFERLHFKEEAFMSAAYIEHRPLASQAHQGTTHHALVVGGREIQNFKTQKEASLKSLDAFARLGETDLLEETYRHYKEILPRVPYPDVEGIQNVLKEVAKRDPKAKGLKPEIFTETRFLKELEASGLVQKLYR